MNLLLATCAWFLDAAHWHGSNGLPARIGEHLYYVGVAVLIGAALALPVGIGLGHLRRGGWLAINIANLGRAIPTLGLVVGMFFLLGYGDSPALIALIALAIPPIVINAYTGMIEIDGEVREAAIALGMTRRQRLLEVELPLAAPMIMAGLRTSIIQVIATATIAAYVGLGGLGRYLIDGLGSRDLPQVLAGALVVAVLAMASELLLGECQRRWLTLKPNVDETRTQR